MNEVTRILSGLCRGDPHAARELLPLVYDELRKLAAHRLSNEVPGQTLQPTALVHEAYIRLVDADHAADWDGRSHFFAAAAEAMRRILIDNARHKASLKAGGDRRRLDLADIEPIAGERGLDLLALDDALARLEARDRRKADVVKLRFCHLRRERSAQRRSATRPAPEQRRVHADDGPARRQPRD
jgi:RNA polymerase sigma factor (TIGR02999 family)